MIPVGLLLGGLNPAKIFTWCVENWKPLVIIAALAFGGYQHWKIKSLKEDLAAADAALVVCADGNKLLADSIDEQNAEIAKWKAISENLQQKNIELATKIAGLRGKTDKRTEGVLAGPTPEGCEEAIQYLRDGVEELRKW